MSKFVLVAEDDTDISSLVLAVLEDAGFKVASSVGADTLKIARQEHPDLILLDYQMPGMDGVRIARELRNEPSTSDIPIVAMTAAGRAPYVCQEMDANGCLGKPFDIDHLVEVVDRMVHSTH
jgi:CheY-like chemotaxis protein